MGEAEDARPGPVPGVPTQDEEGAQVQDGLEQDEDTEEGWGELTLDVGLLRQLTEPADPVVGGGRRRAHPLVRHCAGDVDSQMVKDGRCDIGELDERSPPRRPTLQQPARVPRPLCQGDVQLGAFVGEVGHPQHEHQRAGRPHRVDGTDHLVETGQFAQSALAGQWRHPDHEQWARANGLAGQGDRIRRPPVDPAFLVRRTQTTAGTGRRRAASVIAQLIAEGLSQQPGNRVEGELGVLGDDGVPPINPSRVPAAGAHRRKGRTGPRDRIVGDGIARPVARTSCTQPSAGQVRERADRVLI